MICRNKERGETAQKAIIEESENQVNSSFHFLKGILFQI